jgi:hypothetical protein
MLARFLALVPAVAALAGCDPDYAPSPSEPLPFDGPQGEGGILPTTAISSSATGFGGAGGHGGAGQGAGSSQGGGSASGGSGPGAGGDGPGVTVGAGGEGACDGGGATLQLGAEGRVLIRATIVTPDGPLDGEILIDGTTIACVAASCAGEPGADGASIVESNGYVFPGLIDAHNHILFNIFDEDDWSPSQIYDNHNQWTQEAAYDDVVDAKQYLNGEQGSPLDLGCEMDKYGEMKALIAGTTSVLASPGGDRGCYGSLSRSIGSAPDLPSSEDTVQVSSLGVPDDDGADSVCANFADGDTEAYAIHVGEGVDGSALGEWDDLSEAGNADPGCLVAPQTTIVHGTAFGQPELAEMADVGMSLVWSPKSNVFLYGGGADLSKTTDIVRALDLGINVALGPDWSLGGSVNMLDELRFAEFVDNTELGDILTPRDLFEMATINGARALALDDDLGALEPGLRADLFVLRRVEEDPYEALLGAVPRDMILVMVDGKVLYGDDGFEVIAPPGNECETLDVCCATKFACIAESGGDPDDRFDQTFAQITSILEEALTDYDDSYMPLAPIVLCGE